MRACACVFVSYSMGYDFCSSCLIIKTLSLRHPTVLWLKMLRHTLPSPRPICPVKGIHNVFTKVTFPPWLPPVKIWLHTVSG